MRSNLSRRNLVKGFATSVLVPALLPVAAAAQTGKKPYWMGNGMPQEGPDTPKLADAIDYGWKGAGGGTGVPTDAAIRGVVQLGVYHVLSGGPATLPWTVDVLQPAYDKLKAAGVTMGNLMIVLSDNIIYGRKGRDED